MTTFIAILHNDDGTTDIVHEKQGHDLSDIVASIYPDRQFEIVPFNKYGDLENRADLIAKESKFLMDEFIAHTFMATIIGYTPEPNLTAYQTKLNNAVGALSIARYRYTVYNATNASVVGRVYDIGLADKEYLVKVCDDTVTEYYQYGGYYNGVQRAGVAFDIVTNEVVEYYDAVNGSVSKMDTNGTLLSTTHIGGATLSPEQRALIPPTVTTIAAWSEKFGELIIEFRE